MSANGLIGVIGAGTMGSGIAQVAAAAGHSVVIFDTNKAVLDKAFSSIRSTYSKLVEKGKLTDKQAEEIVGRIRTGASFQDFASCTLIIEAVVERLNIKQDIFRELETIVSDTCILASNTSSLSITSIGGTCKRPSRLIGIHFFNPAPLMPLVEVIPGLATSLEIVQECMDLITAWKKIPVKAKDTPGFIVNRLARSFYGEAIRIHEESWLGIPEGIEGYAYIDEVMRRNGFRMGPFELMDLIGNDINYTVTETVWAQMFFDGRYKPSLTQKRLVEAGRLGRKTGHGYYNYTEGSVTPQPVINEAIADKIFLRILSMLINEAAEALYLNIAVKEDLDTAMTKGVNYPKGLLAWCDEVGIQKVVTELNRLHLEYQEERYRTSVLLKSMAKENKKFYA